MQTSTRRQPPNQQQQHEKPASLPIYLNEGLGTKKTALIIVTVVGCIAILWPKVFYPMMFGGSAVVAKTNIKEPHRGPGDFRTGIRQERPAHLHPDSVYQAMRERGRAIPATPTIPIVERKSSPSNPPPRIVEGRPGPIPGMRPPMGAGAMHQPQAKQQGMGIIMPLYTVGIVVFFGYTIMKIVFKKQIPNAPYGPAPADPSFRKDVFGQENGRHVEDLNGSKLGLNSATPTTTSHQQQPLQRHTASDLYNASLSAQTAATNLSSSLKYQQKLHQPYQTGSVVSSAVSAVKNVANKETDQLMEIEKLRKKLEDTEKAMAKLIAEMNSDQYEAKKSNENSTANQQQNISNGHANIRDKTSGADIRVDDMKTEATDGKRKKRDGSADRTVEVLGMEVTASCEGGQKWTGRPPTPVLLHHHEHSKFDDDDMPEPQSIYLEGTLAHNSEILVADSETKQEEVYDAELNGSEEEPAVILSSKMTLSLISLDNQPNKTDKNDNADIESPLADDIEIIGHDENEN